MSAREERLRAALEAIAVGNVAAAEVHGFARSALAGGAVDDPFAWARDWVIERGPTPIKVGDEP